MSNSQDSKQVYLDQIDERISALNGQGTEPSNALRLFARNAFANTDFPTRKHEDWKYTSVNPILAQPFHRASGAPSQEIPDSPFEAYTFVFSDGQLISGPDSIEAGLFVGRLSDAWKDSTLHSDLKTLSDQIENASLNAFESMALGLTEDPMFIHVKAGAVIEKPIHFIYQSSGQESVGSHAYHIISVGTSAQIQFVETFKGKASAAKSFTNAANRIFVAANGNLAHYRLQAEGYGSFHTANNSIYQARDSTYGVYIGEFGGKLMRHNVHIEHQGENITSNIYGSFIAQDRQHIDTQSFIDHATPNCVSNELYKGILLDHGRGVFNGKIIVRPDAQKINAYQQNAALVLSPDAVMDSKPQLEIFADDVRCSHGATIGQLDPESLFYLKSRGLNDIKAKALLKRAFLKDVMDQFPNTTIADYFIVSMEEELALVATKS